MKKVLLALTATFAVCLAVFAGKNMCLRLDNGQVIKYNVDRVYEVYFEDIFNPDTSSIIPPFIEPTVADTSAYAPLRFRITSDSTVELTQGDSLDSYEGLDSVNIPAKVKIDEKIYDVTKIGEWAFGNCSSLTSVEIPSSVTEIGSGAFCDCRSLTSINIPSSVTSIGERALGGCWSLTSIEIPSSVTSIDNYAFSGCKDLDVVIDNSKVDSKFFGWKDEGSMVNSGIFRDVRSVKWLRKPNPSGEDVSAYSPLKFEISSDSTVKLVYGYHYSYDDPDSINIPAKVKIDGKLYSVTSIADGAFGQVSVNRTTTFIGIPSSVTSIGSHAFVGCSSLTSIEIPSSVTSIDNYAFYGCSSLESINVDAKNPNYSSLDGILYNKDKTKIIKVPSQGIKGSISIPSSVTSIGERAFEGCSSLTSIAIQSSVTEIGDRAFYNCKELDIVIDNSEENVKVGDDAFYGVKSVKWLKEIDEDPSVADTSAYAPLRFEITSDSTVELTYGNYRDLDSVNIPAKVKIEGKVYSVTSIGSNAFYGCSSLTSFNVDANNPSYTSIDGIVYDKEIKSIISVPFGKRGDIIIPDGVVDIDTAFARHQNITSVTIPEGVTEINSDAFSGCDSLTSIEIPSSVTSIGYGAFSGCSSLTSIEIPSSVTEIGDFAFEGCRSLTSVEIPSSVTSIGENAFAGCGSLESINVDAKNPNYSSLDGILYNKDKTEIIAVPKGIKGSVSIPSSVTSIGGGAFYYCSSLTSVEIPSSVTSIGSEAFYSCSSLTSVEIPSSVTSIGGYAFAYCENLDIVIENSKENVKFYRWGDETTMEDSYAFKGVKSVKWLK